MTENGDPKVVEFRSRPCPMCKKQPVMEYRPFCSKRCADLDLGKWLKEEYRMESDEEAGLEEDSLDGE